MKPDWTAEETNAANSLRVSGLAYSVIGKRIGRTAQGVKRRLQYIRDAAA
jgi:hypothetical protein